MATVALIIGHKPKSPGACNDAAELCEYQFNEPLAEDIKAILDVDTTIVKRDTYEGLPDQVNGTSADIAVSMHANAGPGPASGTEVLHWHSSVEGRRLAAKLQAQILEALGLADRGTRPKQFGDRGGHLLGHTSMPCVIAEPFFIDNDSDLRVAQNRRGDLKRAYARGIQNYIERSAP